jgi:hypothetical protein
LTFKLFFFFLLTISIGLFAPSDVFANDGTITAVRTQSEDNSFEHDDNTHGKYNSLVQVDADTYALAYSGAGYDGFITTFTISADGSTITKVARLEHDTANGTYNSLVQVDADTYALAYQGADEDGFINYYI